MNKNYRTLEKDFYEYLARNILGSIVSAHFNEFEKAEDPDFRLGDSHGFEITRAFFDGAGKAGGDFRKIEMKNICEVSARDIKKFEENEYKALEHESLIFGYSAPPQWFSLKEIKDCFTAKLCKIENYHTEIVDLFIFSPLFNYYEYEEIDIFCKWCQQTQSEHERKFRNVYVYDETKIFICNLIIGTTEAIDCDNDTIHKCCVDAKAIAEQLCSC